MFLLFKKKEKKEQGDMFPLINSCTEANSIALMTAITSVETQLGISKLDHKAPSTSPLKSPKMPPIIPQPG